MGTIPSFGCPTKTRKKLTGFKLLKSLSLWKKEVRFSTGVLLRESDCSWTLVKILKCLKHYQNERHITSLKTRKPKLLFPKICNCKLFNAMQQYLKSECMNKPTSIEVLSNEQISISQDNVYFTVSSSAMHCKCGGLSIMLATWFTSVRFLSCMGHLVLVKTRILSKPLATIFIWAHIWFFTCNF